MEGLEPEEKARMKEQMAMQSDPTKMLGQLWGDITGSTEEKGETPLLPSKARKMKQQQQQK